jgi:hypothetical protein
MAETPQRGELEVFFLHKKEYTLSSGERLELPRVGWGKLVRITNTLLSILDECSSFKQLDWRRDLTIGDIIPLIREAIQVAPGKITDILHLITGRPKEWVEEELELEDVLGILVPFCVRNFAPVRKAMNTFLKDRKQTESPA